MTPRETQADQAKQSDQLLELLAEIIYNDVNKITQLLEFYKEARAFLAKLPSTSQKAQKLEQFLAPLESINQIVDSDVVTYYERQLSVRALKEKIADPTRPNAFSERYVLTQTNSGALDLSLLLIRYVANNQFFQLRIALVQLTSQTNAFNTFLAGLKDKYKGDLRQKLRDLTVLAGNKLILAFQLTSQLALYSERLAKYKNDDQDVGAIGENMQVVAGLLATAANAAVTSQKPESSKFTLDLAAQMAILQKMYADEKRRLKDAAKEMSDDRLKVLFNDLIKWQIQKDLVEKEFAKYEAVTSSSSLTDESLAVLKRNEEVEDRLKTLTENLGITEWAALGGALRSFNDKGYQLAYAANTLEKYREYVFGIFKGHAAKKIKWNECATKSTANLFEEEQKKFKANLLTQLESKMLVLDKILLDLHERLQLNIPDALQRIDLATKADLRVDSPRNRSTSLVKFARQRSSSASLTLRGNSSPRRQPVTPTLQSAAVVAQDASGSSSLPTSPREEEVAVIEPKIAPSISDKVDIAQSSMSTHNPGFVGGSRTYDKQGAATILSGGSTVAGVDLPVEQKKSSEFAQRRRAIMQKLRLDLSSASIPTTEESSPLASPRTPK